MSAEASKSSGSVSPTVDFTFDGTPYRVPEGQTVAAALISHGVVSWRHTRVGEQPRGILCGIGVCFDCLITLNGQPNVRACVTRVETGDVVCSQEGCGFGD